MIAPLAAGLLTAVMAVPATAAVVPAGDNWGTINRNTIGVAGAELRTGPFTPPFGTGSLNLSVGSPADKIAYGNEVDFRDLRVADISAIGFSVLTTGENSAINPGNLPNISLEVDPNVVAANYSSLVYNPAAVPPNQWSTIDATQGAGWWFTNGATATATGCNQTHFCTLAEIKTAAPDAVVTYSLAINKGRDYAFHGAVDGVVVNDTTFDFEKAVGPAGPAGAAGAAGPAPSLQESAAPTGGPEARIVFVPQAPRCEGDKRRVLRVPAHKGARAFSARATLRGDSLRVRRQNGRLIVLADLTGRVEGSYNVKVTAKYRKFGRVATVKTKRNLSVACA